jgi:hypothetical protein
MKRFAFVVCVACSSAPPPSFGSTPVATATSTACGVSFEVYSAPDPLVRGASSIELVASPPSAGLAIAIVPFMPAMGHGSATMPAVTDQGNGVYVANDVVMAMPGTWQLRTSIGGGCSDSLVIDVDVQ